MKFLQKYKEWINSKTISEEIKISICDENKIYLKWHRDNVFKNK